MDRVLAKGPIGLHLAWLAAAAKDKVARDLLKHSMSREARLDGRRAFEALAEERGGTYRRVLEQEARVRGTRKEPK